MMYPSYPLDVTIYHNLPIVAYSRLFFMEDDLSIYVLQEMYSLYSVYMIFLNLPFGQFKFFLMIAPDCQKEIP